MGRLQLNTAVATPSLRHLTSDSLVEGIFNKIKQVKSHDKGSDLGQRRRV